MSSIPCTTGQLGVRCSPGAGGTRSVRSHEQKGCEQQGRSKGRSNKLIIFHASRNFQTKSQEIVFLANRIPLSFRKKTPDSLHVLLYICKNKMIIHQVYVTLCKFKINFFILHLYHTKLRSIRNWREFCQNDSV